MTKPQITRRRLLTAGAATALVAAVPAAASAAGRPAPAKRRTRAAIRPELTGQQGNASVTVTVTPVQDGTAIDYTITNVGMTADTFTVSTTDLNNGRVSRKLTYQLDPGDSDSAEVYGALNHTFQINVCQSDGTCFVVGPVGPSAQAAGPARGIQAGPVRPGPTP
jgi:hypothetical protein